MTENHDDIAARLRDEASATAPERLRADVMLRVRAEPRPQRIRPRRSFRRSFVTVAAAACILGAMVFGLSRVDFGASSAGSAGATSAPRQAAEHSSGGGGVFVLPSTATTTKRALKPGTKRLGAITPGFDQALTTNPKTSPLPLRAAILGRYRLAAPIREAFGAIGPHHGPNRR